MAYHVHITTDTRSDLDKIVRALADASGRRKAMFASEVTEDEGSVARAAAAAKAQQAARQAAIAKARAELDALLDDGNDMALPATEGPLPDPMVEVGEPPTSFQTPDGMPDGLTGARFQVDLDAYCRALHAVNFDRTPFKKPFKLAGPIWLHVFGAKRGESLTSGEAAKVRGIGAKAIKSAALDKFALRICQLGHEDFVLGRVAA